MGGSNVESPRTGDSKTATMELDTVSVQITKIDVQFSTITTSIASLRDSLIRMEAEQKVRDQLNQLKRTP